MANRRAGGGEGLRARAALLAFLLLLPVASCRRAAEDQPVLPPDQLANAIEAVRVEHKTVSTPPKRVGFLVPADLARLTGGVVCTLAQRGRPILVAGSKRALAHIDGKPVLLEVAGPMGRAGAFFRAPGVTISLGRHEAVDPKADRPGVAWPVGVTVGGLANVENEKIDATWSCGPPAAAGIRA